MNKRENKINSLSILQAFSYLSKIQDVVPFLLYQKNEVHEFLYNEWSKEKGLFSERFRPVWDRSYPFFEDFEQVLYYGSVISDKNLKVRRICLRAYEDLKKLEDDSLQLAIGIGIGLDKNFGCDENGDRNHRTRVERISNYDLSQKYSSAEFLSRKLKEENF